MTIPELGARELYGLCVAAAGLVFYAFGLRALKRAGFEAAVMSRVVLFGFAGAWLGARVAHALDRFGMQGLFDEGLQQGGASFLGGFVGALVCVVLFASPRGSRLTLLDELAAPLALAYAIGRLGCHFSADGCYGVATDLPWGVVYATGLQPTCEPVHPAPLYESLASLSLWVVLARRPSMTGSLGSRLSLYLVGSGAARFVIEFVRRNETHAGLTQAQWLGISLITTGVVLRCVLMIWRGKRREYGEGGAFVHARNPVAH